MNDKVELEDEKPLTLESLRGALLKVVMEVSGILTLVDIQQREIRTLEEELTTAVRETLAKTQAMHGMVEKAGAQVGALMGLMDRQVAVIERQGQQIAQLRGEVDVLLGG